MKWCVDCGYDELLSFIRRHSRLSALAPLLRQVYVPLDFESRYVVSGYEQQHGESSFIVLTFHSI
jgi:hypothetical protein